MHRLERNQEREKDVNDLEYLKNVVLKVSNYVIYVLTVGTAVKLTFIAIKCVCNSPINKRIIDYNFSCKNY